MIGNRTTLTDENAASKLPSLYDMSVDQFRTALVWVWILVMRGMGA